MTFLQRLLRGLDPLIIEGGSGAVAFSGGGDSLCLLHLLHRLKERSLRFVAIHIDHGLRPDSAQDAERALELSRDLGVESMVLRAEVPMHENLEQAARNARYRLLERVAVERGLSWVATAHTATDQAETVLMRVLRGSGPIGLGGMRSRRPLGSGGAMHLRPMLAFRRAEVHQYLDRHGLIPVEDPTNSSDQFLRNRVRHQLLPWMQRENPEIEQALCRLAANSREEADALGDLAREVAGRWGERLMVEELCTMPRGMRHRVIKEVYRNARGSCRHLTREHVLSVDQLLQEEEAGTRRVDLPGLRAERRYGEVLFIKGSDSEQLQGQKVGGPGRWPLSDGRTLVLQHAAEGGGAPPHSLLRSDIAFPLLLRGWSAGDRIAIGGAKHQRVAQVLSDAKVPRAERLVVPVLLTPGGEVVMVVGHRRAAGYGPGHLQGGLRVLIEP